MMKKAIVVGVTTLTLVGLVGCNQSVEPKGADGNAPKNEQQSLNEANKVAAANHYVGKVDSIVGNQVSLKLIADDFELTDEMKSALGIVEVTEEQLKQMENGEIIQLPDGGSMGMAVPGGATEEESGNFKPAEADPGISNEDLQEQGFDVEKMQAEERAKKEAIFNKIKFSGESKEFTIQAGVPIMNAITGEEGKLTDIKKGSVVDIFTDEKTNAVVRIEIKF